MPKKNRPTATQNEKNAGMAAIAYLIFFVPLLTEAKDDPFVKFHVKQGLVLFILFVVAFMINIIPFLGWVISMVVSIFGIVLMIIGVMSALNGEKKPLPLIGQYAEQFKL